MKSQTDQVLEHLKRHGHITALEAMKKYGIYRLAARVQELRSRGHRIETDMIPHKSPKTGAYGRYRFYSRAAA